MRKVEARKYIEAGSLLLQELVNHATMAFQRCQADAPKSAPSEHLPILANYYHIIEMTDGIEVLISQSCTVPAIPLLRSSFEAMLSVDYLLESDYQKRAFAWLVCYIHERLRSYKILDTSSQEGKEFESNFKDDIVGAYDNLPTLSHIGKAINNLESLLKKDEFNLANIEYLRLKEKKRRKPEWHSLYNGPNTIRELAKHLKRGAEYDLIYRYWASVSHAADLSHFLARQKDGSPGFYPLRNDNVMVDVIGYASTFMLHSTRMMLNKFRPGEKESIQRWYLGNVRENYLKFMNEVTIKKTELQNREEC